MELKLTSDPAPKEARLFHVASRTRDFRDSRWSFEPMAADGSRYRGRRPRPAEGYEAVFGEAVYDLDGRPFTLSTQIRISGGSAARR